MKTHLLKIALGVLLVSVSFTFHWCLSSGFADYLYRIEERKLSILQHKKAILGKILQEEYHQDTITRIFRYGIEQDSIANIDIHQHFLLD